MYIYRASNCYFSRCFGIHTRFFDIDLVRVRAGRVNFGQPSSLTLIKRITAKMSTAVTIKATKRIPGLESEVPCKVSRSCFCWRKMCNSRESGRCSYYNYLYCSNTFYLEYISYARVNNRVIDIKVIKFFKFSRFFSGNKISSLIYCRRLKNLFSNCLNIRYGKYKTN